ncbi:methyltransferase-like protein 5 [Hibiscus syriacus]|uniref:Methyltransferase-like protein 5 n=1 Tax=Hibiscus syriacus TaxID=106335 RepID=A0A6A2Z7V3_HIBSY|nr:methyltransferase-like protein 5 [Hibiscus syriacus]
MNNWVVVIILHFSIRYEQTNSGFLLVVSWEGRYESAANCSLLFIYGGIFFMLIFIILINFLCFLWFPPQHNDGASWNPSSSILDSQLYAQHNMTRQLLNVEDSQPQKSKKHRSPLGSSSQNSESSETKELALELRLSL